MWTRPDTGDTPVSYPVPTYGAVKGIFECILLSDWAEVIPTKVEICKPIVYHNYTTNYGGPLRKSRIMRHGSSYQLIATVVVNVCYRLYVTLRSQREGYGNHGHHEQQTAGTTDGAHAFVDVFERRLKRGQLFSTPYLGWKEFTPDYVGPFRSETKVCDDINLVIPSILKTCFPGGRCSEWDPMFKQDVRLVKGVLSYVE